MFVSHLVVPKFFVTPCTVAHQAPLSMELSRQEYWSGFPFPSPGDLPYPGIEPKSLHCRHILYCLSQQGSPTYLYIHTCIFIYIHTYVLVCAQSLQSFLTLCDPARLLCPWDSLGKKTGGGCHGLLQEIFLT